MTKVSFETDHGKYRKLIISGHSGYADEGSDIVCAAISSTVNLAVSVLEHGKTKFTHKVGNLTATVILELEDADDTLGQTVFSAMKDELSAISEDFPENAKVTVAERIR